MISESEKAWRKAQDDGMGGSIEGNPPQYVAPVERRFDSISRLVDSSGYNKFLQSNPNDNSPLGGHHRDSQAIRQTFPMPNIKIFR